MGRPSRVLAIGSVYLDINAVRFPFASGIQAERETVGARYRTVVGGSAAHFSRVITALGARVTLIGKTGDDAIGRLLTKMVTEQGVESALVRSAKESTNIGINIVNLYGQRVMLVLGTANQSLKYEEITSKLSLYTDKVSYLYLGGYFKMKSLAPSLLNLTRTVRGLGVKVILDPGRLTNVVSRHAVRNLKTLLRSLSNTDCYLPAEDEFFGVFQVTDMKEGLQAFRRISPSMVVVKQSSMGATGMIGHEIVRVPAYPAKPAYTVGAGDAFNAGFAWAQMEEKTFEDSIRFANATAAIKISRADTPDLESVESIVQAP